MFIYICIHTYHILYNMYIYMYTLHTHIYIYIHTYVYIYITNITKYDKDMTCIGPQISQHRFRRSEWGIRRMVPRWRSGAACDLVNMKNSWYSSYGCSSHKIQYNIYILYNLYKYMMIWLEIRIYYSTVYT